MATNPYQAPDSATLRSDSIGLMSWSTIGFIVSVGGVGAVIGVFIGAILAWLAPLHFTNLFGTRSDLEAMQHGIGFGFAQGFGAGTGLGTLLAIAQAWIRFKRAAIETAHNSTATNAEGAAQ